MTIYSKKIFYFIQDIKEKVKKILSKEMHLVVKNDFFLYPYCAGFHPISIVIYESKKTIGYFDPLFRELGFHKSLMHTSSDTLMDVIRHELAHYILHITSTIDTSPHGPRFQGFCQQMGWKESVYQARFCLEELTESTEKIHSDLLRKIQKLLSLASSNNPHEAEAAMLKSRELLLKHHLDLRYVQEEETILLKRPIKQKKADEKFYTISRIVRTFFVETVLGKTSDGHIYLEIFGDPSHIEVAEYVTLFLQEELDRLWQAAQKNNPHLKGLVAKNSFFRGLALGYLEKVQSAERQCGQETSCALILLEKKLQDAKELIYGNRLHSGRSRRVHHCEESSHLGVQTGKKLNIRPVLHHSEEAPLLLS